MVEIKIFRLSLGGIVRDIYKNYIVDKLQRYMYVRDSNVDLLDDIEYLETKLTNITAKYGLQSGHTTSKPDEKVLNILSEIEIKRENYNDNERLIYNINSSLDGLNDMERDIVLTIYGSKVKDKTDIDRLVDDYSYTQRQLYRIANDCLVHISYKLLGDA